MLKSVFQRGDSAEKSLSGGMTTDVKYDFEPYDGKPGESYDKFERRLMNAGSKTDDRGYSYADHFRGVDEGGPFGVAIAPPARSPRVTRPRPRRRQPICHSGRRRV